ncbi:MAG: methyltransferase [Bacteroidales bacterium]|nr:methyltransferase [Bacteroidales bacterium]MBN2757933.1 methyltransferase [Bacteroidales bacterium]
MLNNLIKKILAPFWQKLYKYKSGRKHIYRYKNLKIVINPSVFSPKWTFATKIFLKYIEKIDIENKTFLELGCGSGIVSLMAAKKNAKVYASDINENAIKGLIETKNKYNLQIQCFLSDLFKNIPKIDFDYIYINPPFFNKNPENVSEQAWFCGENFEYFQKLFQQLWQINISKTNVLMILSENANIKKINETAYCNKLIISNIHEEKQFSENFIIYKIEKNHDK